MESWLPWLHPAVIVSVGLQLQRNKTLSQDGFNKWGRNYLIGPQLRSRRLMAVAQNLAMARPSMLFIFSSHCHNVPVRDPSTISPLRTGERDMGWLQPCLFKQRKQKLFKQLTVELRQESKVWRMWDSQEWEVENQQSVLKSAKGMKKSRRIHFKIWKLQLAQKDTRNIDQDTLKPLWTAFRFELG